MEVIQIESKTIALGQFLKWASLVGSGGEVKILLESESVFVNGELEQRRGRKLEAGDRVKLRDGPEFILEHTPCD